MFSVWQGRRRPGYPPTGLSPSSHEDFRREISVLQRRLGRGALRGQLTVAYSPPNSVPIYFPLGASPERPRRGTASSPVQRPGNPVPDERDGGCAPGPVSHVKGASPGVVRRGDGPALPTRPKRARTRPSYYAADPDGPSRGRFGVGPAGSRKRAGNFRPALRAATTPLARGPMLV